MRQPLLALVVLVPLLTAPSLTPANSEVFECDRLAAHPIDPNRPEGISGVFIEELKSALAIPACELALVQKPGHARLQFQLARSLYKAERFPEALQFIRRAVAQGYAPAERNLGHGYYRGKILPLNDAEAVKWFRRAAEKGHALAQHDLGKMYERGHGISQDDAEAANWYRKAAGQMFTLAQYSLAYMYQAGSGVPKDRVQALMWFTIAASLGDTYADRVRELAAFSMSADKVAEAERMAREWLKRISDRRVAVAALGLRPRPVDATQASNIFVGDSQANVSRGRSLISRVTCEHLLDKGTNGQRTTNS